MWIDRAVTAGRISSHDGGKEYWLHPGPRRRDLLGGWAASAMRRGTSRELRPAAVRPELPCSLDFAATVDRAETEHTWAWAHAEQLATDRVAASALLVQLHMSDGDIEAAWQAADRYGPGWAWKELAVRGADARSVDAANLYRPQLEKNLRCPNSGIYPDIAERLATMAELYEKAVAEPISRRSYRRSARTTAGGPR